jgi:hypothetical protein
MNNYEKVLNKIFYRENRDKIKDKYSEKKFLKLKQKDKIEIAEKLNLDFIYLLSIHTPITHFLKIVENFIKNSDIEDINDEKETIVYLTMCALAISFEIPKEIYRKLFTELRMRNVYGLLEDLTTFIKNINEIFNVILEIVNDNQYTIYDMFEEEEYFSPFIISINDIIEKENIDIEKSLDIFKKSEINIIENIVKGMDKNIDINKLKKRLSKSDDNIIDTKTDILNFDDWKKQNDLKGDVEKINEEK